MNIVQKIEHDISELNHDEVAELSDWFADFQAQRWDRQMEADTAAGHLDKLAEKALEGDRPGRNITEASREEAQYVLDGIGA
jgi:hypothetical protein